MICRILEKRASVAEQKRNELVFPELAFKSDGIAKCSQACVKTNIGGVSYELRGVLYLGKAIIASHTPTHTHTHTFVQEHTQTAVRSCNCFSHCPCDVSGSRRKEPAPFAPMRPRRLSCCIRPYMIECVTVARPGVQIVHAHMRCLLWRSSCGLPL
jgi:hypothetical protein